MASRSHWDRFCGTPAFSLLWPFICSRLIPVHCACLWGAKLPAPWRSVLVRGGQVVASSINTGGTARWKVVTAGETAEAEQPGTMSGALTSSRLLF